MLKCQLEAVAGVMLAAALGQTSLSAEALENSVSSANGNAFGCNQMAMHTVVS